MEIYKHLLAAQKDFTAVVFDSKNPHFKSKFASLKAMIEATRPALQKNGFIVLMPWKSTAEGDILLTIRLMHESGSVDSECLIVRGNKTDQQLGSSITYMRRYQYASLLNLVAEEEEDDGEANEERNAASQKTASAQSPVLGTKTKDWKPAEKAPQTPEMPKKAVPKDNVGKLKYLLLEKDKSILRLEEYLMNRSKKSGYSVEETAAAVLQSPDITNKFCEMYSDWIAYVPSNQG